MPTNFQFPEVVIEYIRLLDGSVIQIIILLMIFFIVLTLLFWTKNLAKKIIVLQDSLSELITVEQRRTYIESRNKSETGTGGDFADSVPVASLKLAANEVELKAHKEMVAELRRARDDWKEQAFRLAPFGLTMARAPAIAPPAAARAIEAQVEPRD